METVGARLGVLGGTFDPIHRGHLAMARAARAAHGLPLVLLVPAATPPHKRGDLTAVEHRLAMARIAATGEKGIEVSDIEVRRGGISYTVDTLAELAGDRPRVELFFVIGEDTIPELPYWKDAARILALARVVAVNRPGHHRSFEAALFPGVPASTLARCEGDRVTMEPAPIASRDVRRAIAAGEPFDHWLPAGVGEYIRRHRLYGYPGTGTGTGPGAATTSEGQGGNQ